MSQASVNHERGTGKYNMEASPAAAECCTIPYDLGRILLVCLVALVAWIQLTRTSVVPGGIWPLSPTPYEKLWTTVLRVGILPWVFAVFFWQVMSAYNRSASDLMSSRDPERR